MQNSEHLDALKDIRSIMERSSRFLSLSGLSGVYAGIFALAGAGAAFVKLKQDIFTAGYYELLYTESGSYNTDLISFLVVDTVLVLSVSLAAGFFLTWKKAKKQNVPMFDTTARRLAVNMLIPLLAGGLLSLILLKHSRVELVAPCMLIFYGLALVNGSKYTLHDIRYLGLVDIALGLLAAYFVGYGLLFWALGFGVMHIVYGTLMYFRYER